ncbi:MAG: FkbM family methyltransferase [Rhizomicrobium sp.]|jgi:FkbM family methyltransferase
MRLHIAWILEPIARKLSFARAMNGVQLLLRAQGIGAGATVATSGEQRVFNFISSDEPILFDVGGHVGEYSRAFLDRFPKGGAFLFEPSGAHMQRARQNLPKGVQFYQVALSDTDKIATLYKDEEISGLASLTKRRLDHIDIRMDMTEEIRCRTLDSVVEEANIGHIDLLKIDVEGHELDVLRGAMKTLERGQIDLVQFEFGGCNLDTRTTLKDYFYFFQSLGYTLHLIRPFGDPVALPEYGEVYEQYRTTNYLAMRV